MNKTFTKSARYAIVISACVFAAIAVLPIIFYLSSQYDAAKASADSSWMRKNVVRGLPRTQVYKMLKSRGITAYNAVFIKGKAAGDAGCDTAVASMANWPYRNEPLPEQPRQCTDVTYSAEWARSQSRNPQAEFDLGGGSTLACGGSTTGEITFDDQDRVVSTVVDPTRWICL